jgi:hypothetical protein
MATTLRSTRECAEHWHEALGYRTPEACVNFLRWSRRSGNGPTFVKRGGSMSHAYYTDEDVQAYLDGLTRATNVVQLRRKPARHK